MNGLLTVAKIIRDNYSCGLWHQDRGHCFCDDTRFEGDSHYSSACNCKALAGEIVDALDARTLALTEGDA